MHAKCSPDAFQLAVQLAFQQNESFNRGLLKVCALNRAGLTLLKLQQGWTEPVECDFLQQAPVEALVLLEYLLECQLECIWNTDGMHLECIWNACEMQQECIQNAAWNMSGMASGVVLFYFEWYDYCYEFQISGCQLPATLRIETRGHVL